MTYYDCDKGFFVMNKAFKLVFNRVRNAMMVVNEKTSSTQKGKKTAVAVVAVVGTLVSGVSNSTTYSYDEDTTVYSAISIPTNSNQYAGFLSDTEDIAISIASSKKLTVQKDPNLNNEEQIYGAYVSEGRALNIAGDVSFDLNNATGSVTSLFSEGGNIDISGLNVSLQAEGQKSDGINAKDGAQVDGQGILSVTSSGQEEATGVETRRDADVKWQGDATIDVTGGVAAVGVGAYFGGNTTINGDVTVTATQSATATTEESGVAAVDVGLYTSSEDKEGMESTTTEVNLLGSKVSLSAVSKVTEGVDSAVSGPAYGISAVKSLDSSVITQEDLSHQVLVTVGSKEKQSEINITAESSNDAAYGLYAEGSQVDLSGSKASIATQAYDKSVGVLVTNSGQASIDVTGDVDINATSTDGRSFGILSSQPWSGVGTPSIKIQADNITVTAKGGGTGVTSNWGSDVELLATNAINILGQGGKGTAEGLHLDGYSGDTGSKLTVDATTISIEAKNRNSETNAPRAVRLSGNGTDIHELNLGLENAKTINLKASATESAPSVVGLQINGGTANIGNANADITVSAVNPVNSAQGIVVSGPQSNLFVTANTLKVDANSALKPTGIRVTNLATAEFDAATSVFVAGGTSLDRASDGIRVSNTWNDGDNNSIRPATTNVKFNKSVVVDVKSEQGTRGVAVVVGESTALNEGEEDLGGHIDFNDSLTITSESQKGSARGIVLDNNFLDEIRAGVTVQSGEGAGASVKVAGDLTIASTGATSAYGIQAKDGTEANFASVDISATSSEGNAYGIQAEGDTYLTIKGENVSLQAEVIKDTTQAFAIAVSKGSLVDLDAHSVNLVAKSDNANVSVVLVDDGVLNLGSKENNGQTILESTTQNGYASAITVNSGTLNLYGNTVINSGFITVSNEGNLTVKGNLNLEQLSTIEDGSLINVEGSLTTTSDQIFSVASSDKTDRVGSVLEQATSKLNFVPSESKLILTDALFTSAYYKDAQAVYQQPGSIVMTGQMTDLTFDNLGEEEDLNVPGTTLVIEGNLTITNEQISGSYVVVGSVDLGNGNTIDINTGDEKTFVIAGGQGGSLVKSDKEVKINVDVESQLQIGGDHSLGGEINGSITTKGTVAVKGDTTRSQTVFDIKGQVTAETNATITVEDNAVLHVDSLDIHHDANVQVGSTEKGVFGKLIAGILNHAGVLFIDPEWGSTPSVLAAENFNLTDTAQTTVGRNSLLILGSKDETLVQKAIENTGHRLAANDITAALYVASPLKLNGSFIVVDGSKNSPQSTESNAIDVATGSMLAVAITDDVVNNSRYLFEGNATVNLEEGSYLYLDMDTLTSTDDLSIKFAETVNAGIHSDNIYGSSGLWYDYRFEGSDLKASYDPTPILVAGGLTAPNTFREALISDSDSVDNARELLSAKDYVGVVSTMNNVAMMGAGSAAQIMSVNTSGMIADTLTQHGTLVADYAGQQERTNLWINLDGFFSKASSYDFGSTDYGYRSDIAGATFGADYALGNGVAIGGAVSTGTGSVRGQGNASGIKNEIDYWGLSAYGVWNTKYVDVVGDIGYLQSNNKITSRGYQAKPNTKTISLGVHAEKALSLNEQITVTPHVGLRYMNVEMDDFSAGGFKYEAETANLVQIPVGLSVNGNLETVNGTKVKPHLDLTVTPMLGDRKIDSTFGLLGGNTVDAIDTRISGNAMYSLKMGVNAEKGPHNLDLNCRFGSGSDGRLDRSVQFQYKYSF